MYKQPGSICLIDCMKGAYVLKTEKILPTISDILFTVQLKIQVKVMYSFTFTQLTHCIVTTDTFFKAHESDSRLHLLTNIHLTSVPRMHLCLQT